MAASAAAPCSACQEPILQGPGIPFWRVGLGLGFRV